MTNVYELMKKYGALMASQNYSVGEKARLMLETDEGVFATSYGCDLSDIRPSDIEKLAMSRLPVNQEGMKAMVYSQTPYAGICLSEGRGFKAGLDDMAQIIGESVVIADGTGTDAQNERALKKALRKNVGCMVLTGRDSGKGEGYTVTVGRNLYEAITAMAVLEKNAEVTVLADRIGGVKHLNKLEARLMRSIYKKKYSRQEEEFRADEAAGAGASPEGSDTEDLGEGTCGPGTPAGASGKYDTAEAELRSALVECGKRLIECGLVQGTWGNISVRLDDRYMLVTPSGLDYLRLTPDDMVKVEISTLEYEGSLKPTSEKGLHAEVYKRRPDVKAVIHTHSKYLSVFAAAESDMEVLSENREIFGDVVRLAEYALPGTDKLSSHTADALGKGFGVIMSHHGMAAVGEDLDTAFDNCVKLEENGKTFLENV